MKQPRKPKIPAAVLEFFRECGAIGGPIGAKRRFAKLTTTERSEVGRRAADSRWGTTRTVFKNPTGIPFDKNRHDGTLVMLSLTPLQRIEHNQNYLEFEKLIRPRYRWYEEALTRVKKQEVEYEAR